ncbi:MAG TPA: T9SS type A sorting domain-containing protein [Flavobacteriaceae bacterium]|nr:T9SS type A sorting domain-containing protein [Flavobacteriaceae bacterium]
MIKKLLYLIIFCLPFTGLSQSSLTVEINGLEDGDSAKVKLTKGTSILLVKKAKNPVDKKSQVVFENLTDGDNWVIAIDAPGYAYPTSKVISIPSVSSLSIDVTKYSGSTFVYEWQDDSSYVGHATQTYINEPFTLVVLDDTVSIPIDYSSIKLREEYGIVLSNDVREWSDEQSYRVYSNIERLENAVGNKLDIVDFTTGENLNSVWFLTNEEIDKDIKVETVGGTKHVTISESSLVHAEPMIVKLDGLRGKFYSKRLYKAMLNYFSEFGTNKDVLDKLAQNRFGFRWMLPDDETANLMGEPADNFQEFFAEEKIEILSMFEELPDGFHTLECNKYLVRRVNGQCHPTLGCAVPAIAWTSGVMEWLEKGFKDISLTYLRRLILHEKAHYIWQCYLDQATKDAWAEVGGWYEDPLSSTGWSTWKTTEFVSAYAHLKNPNEDFAESVAYYIDNIDALRSRSMQKYEFIRDRIMSGTRYIAQIRDDLTFTVYNLFPDYFYPGKIIGTKVEVLGESEEDKTVKFTIKLKSDSVQLDGAATAQARFKSSIGTFYDVWLHPKNGSIDSILTGEFTINKHAKSGYWKPSQIQVWDNVGNGRFENLNTVGVKAFVNNPLEDIVAPAYVSYELDTITDYFNEAGEIPYRENPSGDSIKYKALTLSTEWYDASPMGRVLARLQFRNTGVYSKDAQGGPYLENGYNSNKKYKLYWAIPEYFPSDYYSVTYMDGEDIARNTGKVYMTTDTASFNDKPSEGLYKALRDSILIETNYPDTIAPVVDIRVGKITIDAEPVNPIAPDGETKVEINLFAKDSSNYFGKEASITQIYYWLRDPQGVDHEFRFHPDGGNGKKTLTPDSAAYEWKIFTLNARLPKGSAPGKWGLSEIDIWDKAGNQRRYSFVEYLRFDIIKSDIVLNSPLYAEITDKVVNASNVNSISAFITCSPCSDLKYNYTIYSLMGGVVKTGEKVMGSDSVYVTDLDVSGIPDGIIKLTVQLKDSLDQLVATTTTDYTKDVILPNSYYFQSNLQNVGSSNIDSLEITINTVEVNGDYELIIIGDSIIGGNSIISLDETNGPNYDLGGNLGLKSKKIIKGKITNEALKINNLDLSDFADGFITLDLVVTDSALNIGNEIFKDSIFKNLPDAPVSLDLDSLMTDEDITLDFVLSASDADGDSLEFIIVRQPNNGIVVISDSIASYTPNNNYYGLDSLSYKASDGSLESETSEVSISINSVYDLPSVSLFTNNINLIEESGFSEIVVKAEGIDAGDKEISVTLSLTGSSSNADFDISSNSIVINAGDTEGKIDLNVVDDIEFEQEETIIIDIDSVYNGLEDSIQQIIITILESDKPLGNESKSIIYKIYPNPAKHHIIIELNDNYILEDINVIDLSGKFAKTNFSTEKNKSKVDISMLAEGIFILNIITDKGSTNFRFRIEK